ncbi:MAG: porin [Candidatus Hydrogenedentota bacterium]
MSGNRWVAGIVLATTLSVSVAAADASGGELEALKRQVYELTKQLRLLEVKLENDKATSDATAKEKAKTTPKVKLDSGGLQVTSGDDAFQLRIRTRIAHDWAWFNQNDELKLALGDEQDGTGFRYARLVIQGKFWDDFSFNSEIDFAGENGADSPKFRDVYLQYDGVPYGGEREFSLRMGHFREPFSLEELTPVVYRTFVEKSLANVFVPSRNAGIQISDALLGEPKSERLTWAVGLFKETDDIPSSNDSDEDQGYQLTMRLTGLPWYKDEGRKLLHLGAAYSHRNPDGARLPYGTRPESRLALFRYADPDGARLPRLFRLQDARADTVDLFGGEAALVLGPFSLQGEYMHSSVDTTFGGTVDYAGYYAQASYFLTGEHRPYRTDRATFDNPIPNSNFKFKDGEHGWGAWEATARYSFVDMNDGPVNGGEHASYTLGLNWYLNPNFRITWNYIRNEIDHPLFDGTFDMFLTRFQLEF